uniref:Uncharacterized protein n=1 Tax=Oryza sativa subsp. japonica TaxID=39947 RepID=Q69SL6_ORYSJ|nr:hypothetical protein [Oryza sativa Japonica Group]BAD36019.1 hypothetical protein [Oryza sativa Japonica Group]
MATAADSNRRRGRKDAFSVFLMSSAGVVATKTGGEVEDDGEAEDLSLGFFSSRVICGVGRLGLEEMEA